MHFCRPAWQSLLKALNISSAPAQVALDLLIISPSNSIRYNCQKICSWTRGPETILEISMKARLLRVISKSVKLIWYIVFSHIPFTDILKYWNHRWDLPTIRHISKISASTYESSGSISLEPPLEYNKDKTGYESGNYGNIMQYQISSRMWRR